MRYQGVTVVTPTFNRAALLPTLYDSLRAQTFTDFSWLIVDDGSTDDTRELVESWDAPFPVTRVYQPNAGMKVALNRAAELVSTDLIAVIGSDDRYLPDGLMKLVDGWEGLDDSFVSVNGRTVFEDGRLNGTPFVGTIDADSFTMQYRHRITGDTVSLSRTEVVRRFPFPYAEVRSATEGTAFNRVARRYKIHYIDESIAVVAYHPDGLSARPRAERVADPRPWLLYYWEAFTFPRRMPLLTRAKFGLNCVRFGWRRLITPARPRVTE